MRKSLLSSEFEMNKEKHESECYAQAADNKISDAKEWVFSSYPCSCAYNKVFSAIEHSNRKVLKWEIIWVSDIKKNE